MSGPREQTTEPARDKIAGVIQAHSTTAHRCKCGWEPPAHLSVLGPAINGHVADAVVEALGLTEEWRVEMDLSGYRIHCEPTQFPPRGELADDDVVERRWVSGWSVVDGDPK